MLQKIIAIIIIAFFLARLFWQKQKKEIGANEFIFWLVFWLLSVMAVLGLRYIDRAVAGLGFTGSGIDVLLYLAVVVLFYFIFRLRLKIEKMEKNLTKIIREISIDQNRKK